MNRLIRSILAALIVAASGACAGNLTPTVTQAPVPTYTTGATVVPTASPTLLPTLAPNQTPADMRITPNNASRVSELARMGLGVVTQMVYAPDGQTLAVATSVGVYFLASDTLALIRYLDTGMRVASLAFGAEGRLLAVSADFPDTTIQLWDTASGQRLQTLAGHTQAVSSVAFSPRDSVLASGSADGSVRLWEVPSGRPIKTLLVPGQYITRITFSADGQWLATGSWDQTVQVWDMATGAITQTIAFAGQFPIHALEFSPDGRWLALGGNNYAAILLDWRTDEFSFRGDHADIVSGLSFSPDGRTLASASEDNTIKLWAVPGGQLLRTIQTHRDFVESVAFAPNGQTLASGSLDGEVRLWDPKTGQDLARRAGFSHPIYDAALSPDGRIIAANIGSRVDIWDSLKQQVQAHFDPGPQIADVAFSPDGQYLAAVNCSVVQDGSGYCQRSQATIGDAATGQTIKTLDLGEDSYQPLALAFDPSGTFLATASDVGTGSHSDGVIQLWDVETWQLASTLGEHVGLFDMVVGPDGGKLLSGGLNYIWINDTHTNAISQTIKLQYGSNIIHMALSPDGSRLALGMMTGNAEGNVLIVDAADGEIQRLLAHEPVAGHLPQIDSLAYSPDGQVLASGDDYGAVYLWDTKTWQTVARLSHTDIMTGLAFSSDGKTLISSSFDGTLRIWGMLP